MLECTKFFPRPLFSTESVSAATPFAPPASKWINGLAAGVLCLNEILSSHMCLQQSMQRKNVQPTLLTSLHTKAAAMPAQPESATLRTLIVRYTNILYDMLRPSTRYSVCVSSRTASSPSLLWGYADAHSTTVTQKPFTENIGLCEFACSTPQTLLPDLVTKKIHVPFACAVRSLRTVIDHIMFCACLPCIASFFMGSNRNRS